MRDFFRTLWLQVPEPARTATIQAPWTGKLSREHYALTQGLVVGIESAVLPLIGACWLLSWNWSLPAVALVLWASWVRAAATTRRLRSAGYNPHWTWAGLGYPAGLIGLSLVLAERQVPGARQVLPLIHPAGWSLLTTGVLLAGTLSWMCTVPDQHEGES